MTGLERVLYTLNNLLSAQIPDTDYWEGHRVGLSAARDLIKSEIDCQEDKRNDVFKARCAIDDAKNLLKSALQKSDEFLKGRIDSYIDILETIGERVFWLSVAYADQEEKRNDETRETSRL